MSMHNSARDECKCVCVACVSFSFKMLHTRWQFTIQSECIFLLHWYRAKWQNAKQRYWIDNTQEMANTFSGSFFVYGINTRKLKSLFIFYSNTNRIDCYRHVLLIKEKVSCISLFCGFSLSCYRVGFSAVQWWEIDRWMRWKKRKKKHTPHSYVNYASITLYKRKSISDWCLQKCVR